MARKPSFWAGEPVLVFALPEYLHLDPLPVKADFLGYLRDSEAEVLMHSTMEMISVNVWQIIPIDGLAKVLYD